MIGPDTDADEVIREYQRASGNRTNWETHWQEIAERCLPAYSNSFTANSWQNAGEKRTEKIFDSTAPVALGRFASVIDSLLTPQTQKWHRLKSTDEQLNKNRNVQIYFEQARDALFRYRYAPTANFASQNHEVFTSLGAFGTGIMFVDALGGSPGLRYRAVHLGEVYLLENHQGIVDGVIRRFWLTARQALQKWPTGLPDQIKSAAEKGTNQRWYFLHCVKPNTERDSRRMDAKGMKFKSYYVSELGRVTLERGGYQSFPFPTSRYTTAPGEVYGRSPGMAILPAMNESRNSAVALSPSRFISAFNAMLLSSAPALCWKVNASMMIAFMVFPFN
jgi:hypothetical protein